MKTDITKIRKNIFKYMKNKALSLEGNPSKEFLSYQRIQKRHSNRDFIVSNFQKLIKSVKKSQIIYLGDFHSLDQSSRNLHRIIRALTDSKDQLVLGVEFVHIEHQHHIDKFLQGHLSEIEFLENVNYYESWRFPWNQYKVFFELAKENGHKILALNSQGGLSSRDKKAAEIIVNYLSAHPYSKLLVMFGEYHIVPTKLPKAVTSMSSKDYVQTIIHQNLDEVYWKLEQTSMGRKKTQVIEFDENEFSIQSSAPWVKYESMIYWYENLLEDPEFDIHDYMMTAGLKGFNENASDTFLFLVEKMVTGLNLDIDKSSLEDFNLYDHHKMSFILKRVEKITKPAVSKYYKDLVIKGKSFKVPNSNDFYCSNYSMNRLSYLGGIHLWHNIRKLKRNETVSTLSFPSQEKRFTFLVYQFCFAYFCSKIINPYRKCDLYADIFEKSKTKSIKDRDIFKSCIELLEHDTRDIKLSKTLKGQGLSKIYKISKRIGYMLGDILFDQHFEKGSKSLLTILDLLNKSEMNEENYLKLIKALLPKRKYKAYRKRFF
jgi:hypothetical protein